jgi:hypothetical protein
MGYEVWYSYHEKTDEGYNKEEVKKLKKRIGDPFEDVPLEKLAAAIMTQYARRDIWVIGVEILELSKKDVNFREAKNGIIIKNKKFLWGENSNIVVEDMEPAPAPQLPVVHQPNTSPQAPIATQPHNGGQLRPLKFMRFVPELHMMPEVKSKGLKFTPDKAYPVFHIQPHPSGIGEVFKMVDDNNREHLISDKYFVPAVTNLLADRELGFSESSKDRDGGNLYWGGAHQDPDMPDVRRR